MSLPEHITRTEDVLRKGYGCHYLKERATPLYTEMNGGWTANELEAIAADIRARNVSRYETPPPSKPKSFWKKLFG